MIFVDNFIPFATNLYSLFFDFTEEEKATIQIESKQDIDNLFNSVKRKFAWLV